MCQPIPDVARGNMGVKNLGDTEYAGVLKVIFRADEYLPFFPVKTKKLLFPAEGTAWITHLEYLQGIEEGIKMSVFPSTVKLFRYKDSPMKDIILTGYKEKKESEGAKREIAKLRLNSMYGKFGEKPTVTSIVKHDPSKLEGDGIIRLKGRPIERYDGLYLIETQDKEYSQYANTLIASYITAYARMKLWSKAQEFIERGKNVFYMDTDSLITDGRMPTGDGLGEWGFVGTLDWIDIWRAKFYETDNGITAKGKLGKLVSNGRYETIFEGKTVNSPFMSTKNIKEGEWRNMRRILQKTEDNKRDYDKKFNTLRNYDLYNDFTNSWPLTKYEGCEVIDDF